MPVTVSGDWKADEMTVWAVDSDGDMVVFVKGENGSNNMAVLNHEDRKSLIKWLLRYTDMSV